MKMLAIIAGMNTTSVVVKKSLKMSGLCGNRSHDNLCDSGAVHYQLN